jgi:mono/diheme cytochrome c family protein
MKRLLRILGIILIVVIILLLAAVGYVFAQSNAKLSKTYEVETIALDLPTDEAAIAEGERIYISRGCMGCHTADGGGNPAFIDSPVLGTIGAKNLTRGAGGYDYTAEDYIRAIQHGIGRDGHALLIMPSQSWQKMPETELANLVGYLMQLEPVDREMQPATYGIVGRALVAFDILPFAATVIDHENAGLLDIEAAPSVEYGAYLSLICADCHGANFAGQPDPGDSSIISPNLTSHADGLGAWTFEDFTTALRQGTRPDGTQINPAFMPWPNFSFLTDMEIEAIYLYLQSVEPVAGN